MSVRITVLGCSGSVVGPDSPASGYLLRAPDTPPLSDEELRRMEGLYAENFGIAQESIAA